MKMFKVTFVEGDWLNLPDFENVTPFCDMSAPCLPGLYVCTGGGTVCRGTHHCPSPLLLLRQPRGHVAASVGLLTRVQEGGCCTDCTGRLHLADMES